MSGPSQRAKAIGQHLDKSPAKTDLEQALAESFKKQEVPQAVIFATNKDGSFQYSHVLGQSSVEGDARPVKDDDVFQLASQTKLITSIAALQAVERGLVKLDDDVAPHLPELCSLPILLGWEGGEDDDDDAKPILKERKNKITLRLLLTHSVGCVYDIADENIMRWQQMHDKPISSGRTVPERCNYPLIFEPGTAWTYGSNIDWAGLYLERATGMTLEDWFQKYIIAPLGITDMTFWLDKRPDMQKRLLKIALRTDEGGLELYEGMGPNDDSTGCFGGHGLYATMRDYIKVLHSILKNDGKLLKPESVDLMFTPQLSKEQEAALKKVIEGPAGLFFVGDYNLKIPINWGIGGCLFMQDDDGRRKKGTLQWSGMYNTFWIIDRSADIALTFGTHVMMPGDRIVANNISTVERAIYKMAGVTV